ncbi:MAG: YciI family protein [Pseudomonadota bacterium]
MLIALHALDKDGAADLRQANRSDHLAYLEASAAQVVMAGPLQNEMGGMIGSLIVLDLPDMDAARAWAEADPYAKAGLFKDVQLHPWKKVIG